MLMLYSAFWLWVDGCAPSCRSLARGEWLWSRSLWADRGSRAGSERRLGPAQI